MVHLTLAGLSGDGSRLLLVSDAGVEFTLDADNRLRAALNVKPGGDAVTFQARLGQLEIQMDSTLRPRDIQARIRAGETPEAVALAAQTTVEKVMPYATPVLAERAHVTGRAQRASVRRKPSDAVATSSNRTLGDAVGAHLRGRNVDPDTITWDAWRREDGRWTLTGSYTVGDHVGAAHFSFDPPGNYVVADDDDAHWLLGEVPDAPAVAEAPPRDDLRSGRTRRLSAVPPEELPLGEDAIEMVSEGAPEPAEADTSSSIGAEQPIEAYLDDDTSTSDDTATTPVVHPGSDADGESDDDDAGEHASEPPSRKPVKKTKGRASVPSWDEIMFGGGSSEE
jgi:Protein of unknown function (DUF3071)